MLYWPVEEETAVSALIELSEDKISSIRNWATFGIGSQIETSSREVKEALWKRTKDEHQVTKLEAIVGLANRGESQVKAIIIEELEGGEYGQLLFEAIKTFNDKAYLPYLEQNLKSAMADKSIPTNWTDDLKKCIEHLKN